MHQGNLQDPWHQWIEMTRTWTPMLWPQTRAASEKNSRPERALTKPWLRK